MLDKKIILGKVNENVQKTQVARKKFNFFKIYLWTVATAVCGGVSGFAGRSAEISLMIFCVEFGIVIVIVAAFNCAYFAESLKRL